MAKRFVIPFATSGDKSVTPDATDPGGAISYSQGWPVAYQLPDTDPSYRPVGRQEMNGVLFDVTEALAELQTLGFPEWVAVTGLVAPYAINAVLRHNGANWRNTVANNSVEPGTDATWVVDGTVETLTTAGVAPAFTLAPVPAIPAYATDQTFRVRFNATPVGTPTLNVSARGVKNLMQYDSTGAKVQAVIAAGQISNIQYDGTDFVILDALPAAAPSVNKVGSTGAARNWKASTTGTNSTLTASADEVTVRDASNNFKTLFGLSLSASLAASGANGLDTGTAAVSTWYHYYVIWNPTTDARALIFSLSAVSPSLPAGYTHFARRGAVRSDATPANKFPLSFTQAGNKSQYKVAAGSNVPGLPLMATGLYAAYTAIATIGFIPPTAVAICVVPVLTNATNIILVAPNAAYGAPLSSTNPPPMQEYSNTGGGSFNSPKWMNTESTNVYLQTNGANNFLFCFAWEDAV